MNELKNIKISSLGSVSNDALSCVKYTGNSEADSKEEVSAVLAAFRDRAKAENDRFRLSTDSEFWVAVCFMSREEKEEFLRKTETIAHGDKYVDGREFSRTLGVEIRHEEFKPVLGKKIPRMVSSVGVFKGGE
jgi:hypothetical protein